MRTEGQEHDLVLINDQGVRWGVRFVREGDRYGLDDCLTYGRDERGERFQADDPLIEFYDLTHPTFGARGQFVSRYYMRTLRQHVAGGLNLYGGEAAWRVDADVMLMVQRAIQVEYEEIG